MSVHQFQFAWCFLEADIASVHPRSFRTGCSTDRLLAGLETTDFPEFRQSLSEVVELELVQFPMVPANRIPLRFQNPFQCLSEFSSTSFRVVILDNVDFQSCPHTDPTTVVLPCFAVHFSQHSPSTRNTTAASRTPSAACKPEECMSERFQ